MLKGILIVVIVLIAIPLIIALFIKKDYTAEREVIINKPKAEVFEYVKYLKNQNDYSKWAQMDPNAQKEYRGTDGTVGFVSAWKSENKQVGQGEQEIKNIKEGERIDYEIRFIKPFKSEAPVYIIFESVTPEQTKVKWGFHGKMVYPTNFLKLFMDLEKIVGDDLSIGLNNLKNKLEKQ